MSNSAVLPAIWTLSNLEEIAVSVGGGTPSKEDQSYWEKGTIPWISPKDMKSFIVRSSQDHVTEKALNRLSLIPPDSILAVVRSGILSHTFPVALNAMAGTINQDMRGFIPESGIHARYLAWQLVSVGQDILQKCSKHGTTVASIEGAALARFPLAIAPAAEQTRIVEKLEELLSDLDAGVAELKAAQKKLARYRQSLLKAVVEGALTAEWRKHNPPRETGAQLLERILKERRARWEAEQLAKFAEQGKVPPKDWQAKYSEPVKPDTNDLPKLPEGWAWASAEQVCDFITKGTTPPKGLDKGEPTVPFLRVTNLTENGSLDLSDKVFVSKEIHNDFLGRSIVYPNDVLMNIVGPPLGQISLVPTAFDEWNINQAIAIFRAVEGVLPRYICTYLRSATAQQWLKKRAKTTAGQTNLTLEICRGLPVPLPPVNEQTQLVAFAEASLDGVGVQEMAIKVGLKQSAAQRKNILKAAFSGQLVPQDPNDEPASMLLERIRAERASAVKTSGRKARHA